MRTIHEVSKLAGVSVRTLHHYDAIGLLPPTSLAKAGYRLYDDIVPQLALRFGQLDRLGNARKLFLEFLGLRTGQAFYPRQSCLYRQHPY